MAQPAPRPLVLAHRGANRQAPENTLEAFARAMALGADGVELDVHRSADDGLVVHHDAAAEGIGVLAEHQLAAIRDARPDIPTLDEVLDTCEGSLVNVEMKNLPGDDDFDPDESAADLVVALVERRDGRDRVLVSSFNLATIDRVHALDARLPTAFLTFRGFEPLAALELAHERGHTALHPFFGSLAGDAAESTVERAHELGLAVNVWTVNEEAELRRLADAGVDALVTDVPDVALQLLGR
ncbi:MAG: glycerophosphodiester phosphodiesterase [Acidimicrobiia bacterium]